MLTTMLDAQTPGLAIDETIALDINGSRQRLRLCAARTGLPPLVVVQHGPGVPVLHEVGKFQRRLQLERDFLVVYWEQRGCGNASADEARRVSLAQQVEDLQAVLRSIERGRTFTALLRETLVAMVRAYGIPGTVRALRNMNTIQRNMLGDVSALDLLAQPPQLGVPVHFVFGEQDALTAAFMGSELAGAIGAAGTTAVRVPDAGHLVHFDRPDVVRSIVEQA